MDVFKQMKTWQQLIKERKAKKLSKRIYYFLTRRIPRRLSDLKWWILHRTICRYNRIEIPSLSPGYYDKDTQMLHGMFDLLSDYVECELASTQLGMNREKYKIPWYMSFERYTHKHGKELGLQWLDWEMNLRMELDENGCPTVGDLQVKHENTQGWCAKEVKELYLWWKEGRDKRENPWNGKEYSFEIEEKNNKEDTEMLVRLVKIRGSLWT